MALLTAGFILTQIGLRVIPVLLRSAAKKGGILALRYVITDPQAKVRITSELAKKVLKGKYIDDVGKFATVSKNNPVLKSLTSKELKLLSSGERNTLMQEAYRDASRLMQSKTSYSLGTKLAKDIETGLGGTFNRVFASRNFVAGDRTIAAVAKATEKLVKAPKQLPPPGAIATAAKATAEAGKIATQAAKSRISSGMGVTKQIIKQVPKADRKQIIKLQRATEKIKKAAAGTETGPVISEGLRGVGTAPKPAWWQGTIPSWLRVGGKAYEGAYPGAVSGTKILEKSIGAGGMLFGGSILHEGFKDLGLEVEGPPEMTTEQLMSEFVKDYKYSYNPTITKDSTNVILPSAVE